MLQLASNFRKLLPEIAADKILHLIKNDLKSLNIKIGRDKFYDLLRNKGLLLQKKRRNAAKTTNSNHFFRKYANKIKDLVISRANQVFVSDITYIRVADSFYYLALVMDLYSRKIVGYDFSKSLCASGALRAIKMAISAVDNPHGLIHHSDRGIQYCCNEYVEYLAEHGVDISMTEQNHCYENANAERLNGILKHEFYLNSNFMNRKMAFESIEQAVFLYNYIRPHRSLKLKNPNEVYNRAA